MLVPSSLRPGLSLGSFALAALIGLGVPAGAQAATETQTVDKTTPISAGGTLKVRNFSGKVEITGTEIVGLLPRAALDRKAAYFPLLENFRETLILERRLEAIESARDPAKSE